MKFSVRGVAKLGALAGVGAIAVFGYQAHERYKFYSRNAGDGRPVCTDDLQVASRDAVLHVGVWHYLQDRSDRLEREAGREIEFEPYDPQASVDYAAVNSFLQSQPDCCEVIANWRVHDDIGIWRSLNIIRFPNIAWVRIKDSTWKSEQGHQMYGPAYKVDACWNNVRRRAERNWSSEDE